MWCARKDTGLESDSLTEIARRHSPAVRLGEPLHSSETPLSHLYTKWETPVLILQSICRDEITCVKAPSSVLSTE